MKKSELLNLLSEVNDDDDLLFSGTIEFGRSYVSSTVSSELCVEEIDNVDELMEYFCFNKTEKECEQMLHQNNGSVINIQISGNDDYSE